MSARAARCRELRSRPVTFSAMFASVTPQLREGPFESDTARVPRADRSHLRGLPDGRRPPISGSFEWTRPRRRSRASVQRRLRTAPEPFLAVAGRDFPVSLAIALSVAGAFAEPRARTGQSEDVRRRLEPRSPARGTVRKVPTDRPWFGFTDGGRGARRGAEPGSASRASRGLRAMDPHDSSPHWRAGLVERHEPTKRSVDTCHPISRRPLRDVSSRGHRRPRGMRPGLVIDPSVAGEFRREFATAGSPGPPGRPGSC